MGTDVTSDERSRVGATGVSLALLAGLALCAWALVARILTLNVATFDADEHIFALVARDVLHGKLPYAGTFDDKPVGLFYVFALAEWLGNQSLASIHAVGLVSAGVAGWLIYLTGRELRLAPATRVALAGLFSVELLLLGGWASMSEVVVAPLICAANLLILRGRLIRWPAYATLGLIFGTVCQISYLATPGLALTALGLLIGGTVKESLSRAIAIGAGFAVAVVVIWLPQLLTGDWLPYIQDQLHFYRSYRPAAQPVSQFTAGFLAPVLDIFIPVLAAALCARLGQRGRRALPASFWPIALQVAGMTLAACASNRYYPHYLILSLPGLMALTALFLAAGPARRESLVTLILLGWGAAAAFISANGLLDRLNNPGIEQKASQLVERLVGPGRRVFVFDETPAIYFLSRSEPVGRYVIPNDYLPSCDGVAEMESAPEAIAASLRARPDLILSGSLCDTDVDSDGMFRRAGYVLVGKAMDGGREIDAYAPAGAKLR